MRPLEVRPEVGGPHKTTDRCATALQVPQAGRQQDRESSIIVDVGRWPDETVAQRHDGGLEPQNDRFGQFKVSTVPTGGLVQIDGAA